MAVEKDLDIDLNDVVSSDDKIADISFDDAKEAGLDDFLGDVDTQVELPEVEYKDEVSHTHDGDDVAVLPETTEADFANLNLNDFNAALDSFKAARAGKVSAAPVATNSTPKQETPVEEETSFADGAQINYTEEREFSAEPEYSAEEKVIEAVPGGSESESTVSDLPIEEGGIDEAPMIDAPAEQQEIINWYTGSLKDKTYKISNAEMPEFLDGDNSISVIHVSIDSPYGWNVFFDNGMFMSLRDVKEYQERQGELPCQDGKIIYGDRSCSFERILKIVVYEQPRYFSYQVKQ
ncbi:MAG: hypothetical protein Q4D11_02310 [Rhodospirillales bacterium]|nr:hypothetical protein [Rhodospirillales bacterium]